MSRSTHRVRALILSTAACLAIASPGRSADRTWDNGAGTWRWNDSELNWSGAAFGVGDNASFTDLGAGTITLATAGGAFGIAAGAVAFDVSAEYALGSVDVATRLALDGALVASGVLSKSGAGTVTFLHGGHSLGGIQVSGGTLRLVSNFPLSSTDGAFDDNAIAGPIVIGTGATLVTDTAVTKMPGVANGDNLSPAARTLGTAAIQLAGGSLVIGSRGSPTQGGNFRAVDWTGNAVQVSGDSTIAFSAAPGTSSTANHNMWLRLGPLAIGNQTLNVVLNNSHNVRFTGVADSLPAAVLSGHATIHVSGSGGGDGVKIAEQIVGGDYDLIKAGPGRLSLSNDSTTTPNDLRGLIILQGSVTYRAGTLRSDRAIHLGASDESAGPLDAILQPNNRDVLNPLVVRAGNSGLAQVGFGSNNPLSLASINTATVTLEKDLHLVPAVIAGGSAQTIFVGGNLLGNGPGAGVVEGPGGIVVDVRARTNAPFTSRAVEYQGSEPNTYGGTTRVLSGILRLNKTSGVTAVPGDLVVGDGALGANGQDDLAQLLADEQIADAARVTIESSGRFEVGNRVETIRAVRAEAGGTLSLGNEFLGAGRLVLEGGGAEVGVASATSVVRGDRLLIEHGSVLDVRDSRLVVDYDGGSALNAVRQWIRDAYAGGAWNGPGIATSKGAGYAVGFAEASAVFGAFPATYGDVDVDDSAVLVRGTLVGDANLDGVVDVADLGTLATNWQGAGDWGAGDFNYDGAIDVADLGGLATNWQAGVVGPAAPDASLHRALTGFGLAGATPEPGSLGLLGMFAAGAMWRRRA